MPLLQVCTNQGNPMEIRGPAASLLHPGFFLFFTNSLITVCAGTIHQQLRAA